MAEHERRRSRGEEHLNKPVEEIIAIVKTRMVEHRKLLGDAPPMVRVSPQGVYAVFWGRKTKWLPQGGVWQVAQDPFLGGMLAVAVCRVVK